jgi:hypothetical protein
MGPFRKLLFEALKSHASPSNFTLIYDDGMALKRVKKRLDGDFTLEKWIITNS